MTGTVGLSKINIGGDFPGSHLGDDQNTFIVLDSDKNGLIATGNSDTSNCPGENCNAVEMELEIDKYPLFAWAGEGDRIAAVGRWVFDCGHPDAAPLGRCSNSGSTECIVDSDCSSGGTCTSPAPNFQYRAELHPPQAVAVIRDKSIGRRPATRADVFISADGGGAGDRCTVEHFANPADLLTAKECFLNHCSVTTTRSCLTDADCDKKETCIRLDPSDRLVDVNAADFQFDIPLPPQPEGATKIKIKAKKVKTKILKDLLGTKPIMPKPTFVADLVAPTPVVHVTIPMTTETKKGLPNVFGESISVAWKGDKTKLQRVLVKFTGLTINNPLKAATPPVASTCTDPVNGGLSSTSCTSNADCPTGTCDAGNDACNVNTDCHSKTDVCSGGSQCVGGITPGWEMFGQVNGDWVKFSGLETVGATTPFEAPPYVQPAIPSPIKQKAKFKEFLASDGSIHIATTGHSLNCLDLQYGKNLLAGLQTFGLTAGAACLLGTNLNPGRIDVTFAGPDFNTPTGSPTTCTPSGKWLECETTSEGGDAGTCSITTDRLCIEDADCPEGETCNVTGGAFTLQYEIKS